MSCIHLALSKKTSRDTASPPELRPVMNRWYVFSRDNPLIEQADMKDEIPESTRSLDRALHMNRRCNPELGTDCGQTGHKGFLL